MTVSSLLSSIILKCFLALGIMKESSHQVNYMISSFPTSLSTRLTPCISVEYVYRQWDTLYSNQFSFFLCLSLSIYLASQPHPLFLQLPFLVHFSLLSLSLSAHYLLSLAFLFFVIFLYLFPSTLFLPNFSTLSLPSVSTYLSLSTPFHYPPLSIITVSLYSLYPLYLSFVSTPLSAYITNSLSTFLFFLPPLSVYIYISSLQLYFPLSPSTLSLYSHCTPISTLSRLSLFAHFLYSLLSNLSLFSTHFSTLC